MKTLTYPSLTEHASFSQITEWPHWQVLSQQYQMTSNMQLSTDCLFPVSILPGKYIDISQFSRTSFEVTYNILFVFKIFAKWTTAELFEVKSVSADDVSYLFL